jgi:hypothetical protein
MSTVRSKALLSAALDAIATELFELASKSAEVQAVISPLFSGAKLQANDTFVRMQQLDLVTQNLGEIAAFLVRLSLEAPKDCRLDTAGAAASVTLSDLAQRLSCQPHESVQPQATLAGDPDWF